ncbi:hypothetical protein R6Q59_006610 [Mikania micrantha]|uniref:Adenylate isopentenyltransferase n=1 Tax=Mikania micrantha TaxID=192012 RepID=A0A5N6PV09_9ASTR|nr:hypothetical protein E3N88_03926 [Mikania micrantha]
MRLQYPTTSQHHRCNLFTSFLNFSQPNSSSTCHKQTQKKSLTITATVTHRRKRKIVVIIGPTGAGKSRLSIDLATRFFSSEIINSDKMQVYSGLDITTNKITMQERLNVPHHLLGEIDPEKSVFTPSDYREIVPEIISDVKSRSRLPLVVGGSSSLIYSLVTKRYDPNLDVFNGANPHPVSSELRYDCCFIWVDVLLPVLNRYLAKRVDKMLDLGMFEELVEFFRSGEHKRINRYGLGQAIGIPEFETYFEKFAGSRQPGGRNSGEDVMGKMEFEAYNEAVRRIKDNTCQLAKKQVSKILRLRDAGWELKSVDATEAFRAVMTPDYGGGRVAEIWEKDVVEPSVKIVRQFLDD